MRSRAVTQSSHCESCDMGHRSSIVMNDRRARKVPRERSARAGSPPRSHPPQGSRPLPLGDRGRAPGDPRDAGAAPIARPAHRVVKGPRAVRLERDVLGIRLFRTVFPEQRSPPTCNAPDREKASVSLGPRSGSSRAEEGPAVPPRSAVQASDNVSRPTWSRRYGPEGSAKRECKLEVRRGRDVPVG
jgi:hypothetical protein